MEDKPVQPWNCESSSVHADCRVYRILKERWSHPAKISEGDFYVMDVGDWAVTVALTESGSCVLVRQFRFGTGDLTWELPAGVIDPGEDALTGGQRELYEESGYVGKSAKLLGIAHPNPAIQRNRCHFILVEEAFRKDSGNPGPHEFFDVREVPLDTLFEWARNGIITHSIVLSALFFLRDYLEKAS